ncbi:MAG: thioredoxin [Armatimonadota bacterium]
MRIMNRGWLSVVAIIAVAGLLAFASTGCEVEDEKTEPTQKTTERDAGQPDDRPSKFDEDGDERSPKGTDGGVIIKSDQASFQTDVLQSDVPVLLDFTADWCPPCRALHPTLEELAEEYDGVARIVQVDVDENGDLAREYDVRGIPALFVIKDGEVVDDVVGLQSKADLKRMLDKHVG